MSRNATLDLARLVAAFGIVLFHSHASGSSIGYLALPFFTMLLIVLTLPAAAKIDFQTYGRGRASRLLGPWLGWSIVYGTLKLAEVNMTGKPLSTEFYPLMLLTGPALHLWFMPFAFVVCLAIYPLAKWHPKTRAYGLILAGLAGLTLGALWFQQQPHFPSPLSQWLFALPSVLFGLGFGLARGKPQRVMAAALTVAGITMVSVAMGWTSGVMQFFLAALALTLCLTFKTRETQLSRLSATSALGVYLSHPMIASLLERLTPVVPRTLGFALLTGVCALALTLTLAHIWKLLRYQNK